MAMSVESPAKLMLRRPEAAAACGKGTSTWDRLTAAGLTPAPVKLGGSVLWCSDELAAWVRHGCPPRAEWAALWPAIRRQQSR
ncbi:hypothetical protein BH11PLA2_BH11PLA2_02850 [soil metagenome]